MLSDEALNDKIGLTIASERNVTAELIGYIADADRRQLFLKLGFTSLYQYLVSFKYPSASAQRRIDAARLHNQIGLVDEIKTGEINLGQISILAQYLRRVKANKKLKREIVKKIMGKDIRTTQMIICEMLNIAPIIMEKKTFQRDGSVRVEVTFSKEQWEKVGRVKELISHTHPNPDVAQVVENLATDFINRKDPAKDTKSAKSTSTRKFNRVTDALKRTIFREQQTCQWRDPKTGNQCGSKFQSQIDHIIPLWKGGTHDPENLQNLCSKHNRWKYQQEGGARWAGRTD